MKLPDTSFVHRSDMTPSERIHMAEADLDRAIQRESRRAMEVSSLDEMLGEMLDEMREIANLKTCNPICRRRIMAMVLRTEKDIASIFRGVEYVRRRRSPD